GPNVAEIGAQVVHAVRHEMARHLADVVFRRTGLGTLGHPGPDVISRAAELMARELGWDETALAGEIAETTRAFEPQAAKGAAA
ncbi:MAG: glycerol-3-phosphate dehydrogenase C-terminal domain-containing protein, partial [Parvibaculum sp.]